MKKYKKIFSGLGLLSITTLMGASIVACSPKEEKGQDPKAPEADKKDPKNRKQGKNLEILNQHQRKVLQNNHQNEKHLIMEEFHLELNY
ncbi:hypothetical protein ONA22_05720 [Mycoplasmopsis cynos]|uniref:Vmc-like lipoprotein signal peptide domain-containing protein n=1 Tax=Mycoplasmopsis cynos TaxID=171284 RepID=UPI0024CDD7BE|nr:hypothetical protein [Mycoplasmopsis cynos]WAM03221.1 hypothetical protein ONA22_05720 [Mycoplasmopsis cynos]